jgi:hypothetical protein
LDKAAKLIVSHFRRFVGLTIHIESFKGKRIFEKKAMRFPIVPKKTEAEGIPVDSRLARQPAGK